MGQKRNDIPWPQKGNKAFKRGENRETLAQLDWLGVLWNEELIAEGFKEAADRVVEYLDGGTDLSHPDKYFFPVTYMYRHYIELSLKNILQLGLNLNNIRESKGLCEALEKHNLHKLWNHTRKLINNHFPKGNPEDVNTVGKIVLEFHKIDRTSQETRYAQTKGKQATLQKAPRLIDLQNLKEVMDNVYSFFCGITLSLEHAIEIRQEMQQDMEGTY